MFWCSNETMPKCPHCFIIFRGAEQELFQVIWTYIVVDRLLKLWILSTLLIGVINLPNCNTEVTFLEQVPSRSGLCCMRRCTWLMDEWMNKRAPDDLCSHFSFSFLLLRSHRFIILSFHISCLSFPRPPSPSSPSPHPNHHHHHHHHLFHLRCIRAPVVSARDKRMRAPGGPRLLCHTSLTLSQSHTHTHTHKRDLPAFVPSRQCLRVVMVTCSRFCRWGLIVPELGRDGALGGWSLIGACHAVPRCAMPRQVNLLRPLHSYKRFILSSSTRQSYSICVSFVLFKFNNQNRKKMTKTITKNSYLLFHHLFMNPTHKKTNNFLFILFSILC